MTSDLRLGPVVNPPDVVRIMEVRDLLLKYGNHRPHCSEVGDALVSERCNCGLSDKLDQLKGGASP